MPNNKPARIWRLNWQWLHKLTSPKYFYTFAAKVAPWCGFAALLLFVYGLVGGLVLAPADYQQGDGFRIIYVHVPAALLSLGVYSFMALAAVSGFVWRLKLADVAIKVSAPLGAWFTFLALVTGSIWGKPMWGTYWVWDARLTSELILLFIYVGVIALRAAMPDPQTAARAVGLFVLLGFVNIPIIHFSVNWWNTLHQGATLHLLSHSLMPASMLDPLLAMMGAFGFYFVWVLLLRMRREIRAREVASQWMQQLQANAAPAPTMEALNVSEH